MNELQKLVNAIKPTVTIEFFDGEADPFQMGTLVHTCKGGDLLPNHLRSDNLEAVGGIQIGENDIAYITFMKGE